MGIKIGHLLRLPITGPAGRGLGDSGPGDILHSDVLTSGFLLIHTILSFFLLFFFFSFFGGAGAGSHCVSLSDLELTM